MAGKLKEQKLETPVVEKTQDEVVETPVVEKTQDEVVETPVILNVAPTNEVISVGHTTRGFRQ